MNPTAVDALELASHRPQLVKFALLRLRSRAASEDAVQETLLAAIEGADRFAGESSVQTWLIGILKHKIVDHIRRQSRAAVRPLAGDEGVHETFGSSIRDDACSRGHAAPWGDPEAALAGRQLCELVQECLGRLPAKTARAFTMREVTGLTTGEICRRLRVSEANCWVMLHRARRSLRESLRERWLAPAAGRHAPAGRFH